MQFTDSAGHTWRIANVADIPFPTRVGGNTPDCPLLAACRQVYAERGDAMTSQEVLNALRERESEVKACWHHRFTRNEQHYIAELSCWFVENKVEPYLDRFEPVVKREGHSVDVEHAVIALFDDPLHWTFQANDQLTNGQHRLCAMKAWAVKRVVVEA
jgi:hypothetical protein